MKTMVTLTHEEAQSYLAYALICETMEGAFWNSGRRRRLYSKTFTEAEQRQIPPHQSHCSQMVFCYWRS